MDSTPLSKLQFNITKMLFTNGNNLSCYAKGITTSDIRITTEYEIALFSTNSCGQTFIDGKEYYYNDKYLRILRPDQSVYTTKFEDIFVIHFTIDNDKQNSIINNLPAIIQFDDFDIKLFKEIFEKMMCKYIEENEKSKLILNMKFCELLILILNKSENNEHIKKISPYAKSAVSFIENNYMKNIALEDISNAVNLHSNYFHKIFKDSFGITPREYLTKTRLFKAKQLLISTTHSISDIAIECGFDSTSYFIKLFKNEYQLTPNLYREKTFHNIE